MHLRRRNQFVLLAGEKQNGDGNGADGPTAVPIDLEDEGLEEVKEDGAGSP